VTTGVLFVRAGFYNDFYSFDPARMAWTVLSLAVPGISKRQSMGLVATLHGQIYMFGGGTPDGTY
jgi:hypothetical protein